MKSEDFSAWLLAISGMSAAQRTEALTALKKASGGRRCGVRDENDRQAAQRMRSERPASSGSSVRAVRIARAARSSAGVVRTGFCGIAAKLPAHVQRADQDADGASAQEGEVAGSRPGDDRGQEPGEDRGALRRPSDDGVPLASSVSARPCKRQAPEVERDRRSGRNLHSRILQGPTVRPAKKGAKAGRNGPASRPYQDNIPVLVARDRKGATFDAIWPRSTALR